MGGCVPAGAGADRGGSQRRGGCGDRSYDRVPAAAGACEFAIAWDSALKRFRARGRGFEAEVIQSFNRPSPGSPAASPTSPASGSGELVGAGSQLKRAGHDRWSAAREKAFFDELAATANVKRAAAAAGVSANAVYARRMKHPLFKAKWTAVLETGRASIEMHLVEAANRTFDPDEIDTGETEPKVSVAEAIRIVQLHGTAGSRRSCPIRSRSRRRR